MDSEAESHTCFKGVLTHLHNIPSVYHVSTQNPPPKQSHTPATALLKTRCYDVGSGFFSFII
jgi:hypothetical protein